MYAIFDARGRRMVMPCHGSDEAIQRIAGAFVGRAASLSDKLTMWERLRGQGYRVAWVSDAHALRAVGLGST